MARPKGSNIYTAEEAKQRRRQSDKKSRENNIQKHLTKSRIQKWKKSMRYWGTWEELDKLYNDTEICPLCNCKLSQDNNSFQKSVDHDHFSKYVRNVICKNCNNKRGKVDRNKMFLHLELYRYFTLQDTSSLM